jgi:hypothetical protein
MSFGSNGQDRVCWLRKIKTRLHLVNLCVKGSSSASFASTFVQNETVRNAAKHEFCVQWSGSGAFVAKNFDANWYSKLVCYYNQFGQFCIDFHAIMKWSETSQNMSFGSNGLDRVRSLRKIRTRLHLANFYVNGTSSASFASTFVL